MERTDEQIDAIVLARDIMLQRSKDYLDRAKNTKDWSLLNTFNSFSAAYHSAADMLTEALNENWEVLRQYEGA